MSRCVVALEVSEETYTDIRKRIVASGYSELIIKGPLSGSGLLAGVGCNEAINLDGIAIVPERAKQPRAALINGRYVDITDTEVLTYDHVVRLAQQTGHPTIIWHVASTSVKDSGALLPGQSIPARDGLIIDCVHTGDA